MKKNGFTLIELLIILILISLISFLAVPNITNMIKKGEDDTYNTFLNNVFLATEAYIEKYKDDYPSLSMEDSTTYVYMKDLVDEKLISTNLVNPKYCVDNTCTSKKIAECSNKTCIVDDYTIIVTKDENGKYKYELRIGKVEEEITNSKKNQETEKIRTFSDDSWEVIIDSVKKNQTEYYHVGDTKEVDMGEFGVHTVRIANMSTPSECSAEGFSQTACGFVLEFVDEVSRHQMNPKANTYGGWEASLLRTYVNDDIYNALPVDLRKGIIDMFEVSSHSEHIVDKYTQTEESNHTSINKLYLLAPMEIYGEDTKYDTAYAETRQLDYYKNIGVTSTNHSGVIKKKDNNATYWWLRSPYHWESFYYYCVNSKGEWFNNNEGLTSGVIPAFRIG